jgi:hypothetical protein
MKDLPHNAAGLSDGAIRALLKFKETYAAYQIQKIDGGLSYPLLVRVLDVSLDHYKRAKGTPEALFQTLFPGSHIDLVLSRLNHEANATLASAKGLKKSAYLQALHNDYCFLDALKDFLKPLVRHVPSYDPWYPPQ